jgi:hypothetical protein
MGNMIRIEVPKELAYVEVGGKPVVELGIEEFLDVLDFLGSGYEAFQAAKEDGSVDLGDVFKIIEPLKKLPAAIAGITLVPTELLGVDLSEADEIIAEVVKRFDVEEVKAKAIIEHAVKAAVHIKSIFELFA